MLPLPALRNHLSARLLALTVAFVVVIDVAIFVPAVARFRLNDLAMRIDAAHLATFALREAPDNMVSQDMAQELLAHVGAHGIVLHEADNTMLLLDAPQPPAIDHVYDLRHVGLWPSIKDAIVTLAQSKNRVLRVLGVTPKDPDALVEVLIDEAPLRHDMWAYGSRLFGVSLTISVLAGLLLYASLQWMLVAPLRRLTASMIAFRDNPEDASRVIVPGRRSDELGLAQRELAAMQETVRQALRQKERLAALGTAVTKINHDLRNILATVRLISDGLANSTAPEVRKVTPTLLAAIDRAVALCSRTLSFTREGAPPLQRSRFALTDLVAELGELIAAAPGNARIANHVGGDFRITADRNQLFRALQNLAVNAVEAGAQIIEIRAHRDDDIATIEITDDGPGLPAKARENLFRPFAGSARPGGSGLGLPIAREMLRTHGGDLQLMTSTKAGSVFRLILPQIEEEDVPSDVATTGVS